MKYTSPTLLIIAALAAAPGISALSVKDDDVKLGLAIRIQARADVAKAETPAGNKWDAIGNRAGGSDPVDFYLRRTRFYLKGSYKSDYKFNVTFVADKKGNDDGAGDPAISLYEAYIARVWKDEANGLEHELIAGRQNAFYNGVYNSFSSGKFLLPSARATDQLFGNRGTGLGYRLSSEMVTFGADVQNNQGDTGATQDGMFYDARIEVTPPGEMAIKKNMESFVGAEGKGVKLTLDVASNVRQAQTTDTLGWGSELLVHVDGLTALAEYRTDKVSNKVTETDIKKVIWLIQAGYALPLGDAFIEPAIRYTKIDLNKDNDAEGSNFGSKLDYGASGSQIEGGVTYYISGHNNKLQLEYLNWQGEENAAGDKASADIVRAQWNLDF